VCLESRCALSLRCVDRHTDLVQEQFAKKYPETPVLNHNAVRRLFEKFRKAGSVLDAERSGRHHFQHIL
jgi:hypothetical protein